MKQINAIADWMAIPATWERAILRLLLLLICGTAVVLFGNWVGLPVSIGAAFGYIWGSLTTYGNCRRCNREGMEGT